MRDFKLFDLFSMAQSQANVVKTIGQAVFAECADLKWEGFIACTHQLRGQVNGHFKTHETRRHVKQFVHLCSGQNNG